MRRVPVQQGPPNVGAACNSNQPPSPPDGFLEDDDHHFHSIDPATLPFDGVGNMMFPIPEEKSSMYPVSLVMWVGSIGSDGV